MARKKKAPAVHPVRMMDQADEHVMPRQAGKMPKAGMPKMMPAADQMMKAPMAHADRGRKRKGRKKK